MKNYNNIFNYQWKVDCRRFGNLFESWKMTQTSFLDACSRCHNRLVIKGFWLQGRHGASVEDIDVFNDSVQKNAHVEVALREIVQNMSN
jgi:hypothetical protein